MFTSNSRAEATSIRDSETDGTESLLRKGTPAWLATLLHWALKASSCFRGDEARHSNTESSKASMPLKPMLPAKSSGGLVSCRCARRRWWPLPCRKSSSVKVKTASTEPTVLVTVQPPLSPAEDKAKDCPKSTSQDVAPTTPVDLLSQQSSVQHEDEEKKKPMLPMEALHRIVSPAARSVAALQDISVPTTPKLLLPEAAFARAPEVTPEADSLITTKRSQRKKTTRVSFLDSAEWVLFDVDHPTIQPVVKSCPTCQKEESPRSPRPSMIKSSALSFHRQLAPNMDMQSSNDDSLKESMRGAATPKARATNPYVLGCCVSPRDDAQPDVELTDATPKAGRLKLPTFGASDFDSLHFMPCTTPKTGSSSSTSFGFSDEPQSEDCITPKASSSCGAQFGFCEALPPAQDLGDDLQSESDSASPSLHNECKVDSKPQEYTYDLSSSPPIMGSSCQSGSIGKSPESSGKCAHSSLLDSSNIALEVS